MCSHPSDRVFDQPEWHALRTKLGSWRVKNFLSIIFSHPTFVHPFT